MKWFWTIVAIGAALIALHDWYSAAPTHFPVALGFVFFCITAIVSNWKGDAP